MFRKNLNHTPFDPTHFSDIQFGLRHHTKGITFRLYSGSAQKVHLMLSNSSGAIVKKCAMKGHDGIWETTLKPEKEASFYSISVDDSEPLLDPYATEVSLIPFPRSPLALPPDFDWQNVPPPRVAEKELIIYEMHARGFTCDSSSRVQFPGTFLGIIEKIPYLQKLGINAIELMPIQEFDEKYHLEGKNVENFWGYGPLNFFSICSRYGSPNDLKTLVRELHRAGIEIFLDVAFSHTSRPLACFETIDKETYFILDSEGDHTNFSGCGRTFNTQHPICRKMIMEALHQFVCDYQIDGFRFDLAAIMTRDTKGTPLAFPPLIKQIAKDPLLLQTKLIAEAWDAEGLYLVGRFPHFGRFAEWNGTFRDRVRDFLRGSDGYQSLFAQAITGSEKLYGPRRGPQKSINFITAHDGFTLADLVSYQEKHNLANLENNQDGTNDNRSWNCGVEGPTNDPAINELRLRQRKNFMVALFTSLGTPMMLMGDEYGHTHRGNNNPWCQNNDLNWFLWGELEEKSSFFEFVKKMIALRKRFSFLQRRSYFNEFEVCWHGTEPNQIHWETKGRFLAYTIHASEGSLYIAYNAHFEPLNVTLPKGASPWIRLIDTNFHYPFDITETAIHSPYVMNAHSALVLWSPAKSL